VREWEEGLQPGVATHSATNTTQRSSYNAHTWTPPFVQQYHASIQVNKLGQIFHITVCVLPVQQVLCTGLLKCSQSIHAEDPDCMTYMPA